MCPRGNKKGFLTGRLVGSPSYYVLYRTKYREGNIKEYKYTGKGFVHAVHFQRHEYENRNPKTGETKTIYLQRPVHLNVKSYKRLIEVPSDRSKIRYYVGHYDQVNSKYR